MYKFINYLNYMTKEMLSPSELRREREKSINSKASGIEGSIKQIKDLQETYEEAKKNFDYYANLKEGGQLSENELENFEKAKILVAEIEEKLKSHEEGINKNFSIPEVEEKIQGEALSRHMSLKEKEDKERKINNMKIILSEFLDKLINEAEKIKKEINEFLKEFEDKKNSLFGLMKAEVKNDSMMQKLNNSLYIHESMDEFKKIILERKKELGFFAFGEKKSIDVILSSKQLSDLEKVINDFASYREKTSDVNTDMKNNILVLFKEKGYGQELKEILNQASKKPDIYHEAVKIFDGFLKEKGGKKLDTLNYAQLVNIYKIHQEN